MVRKPEIAFWFRGDRPGASVLNGQFNRLTRNGQLEFFHLCDQIAGGGHDKMVTLDGRYEANAVALAGRRAWISYVCDMSALRPRPATVLQIAATPPTHHSLYRDACDALGLVAPSRQDH